MRLSVVFELLLVFLFLAFAAARVIEPAKGNKNVAKGNKKSTVLRQGPPNRYCACTSRMCNCCRDFSLPVVPLKGPGCASIMYVQRDTMMVTMSFGDRVLSNTTISGKTPKPICMALPGGISQFCGRIYGISRKGEQFRACLGLELRALDDIEAALRVSCFKFGPKGVKLESAPPVPAETGGKDPDEDEEEDYDLDDDEDDDLIGFGVDDEDDGSSNEDNEVESDSVDYTGFSVLGEDLLGTLFSDDSGSSSAKKKKPSKKTVKPQVVIPKATTTTRRPLLPNRRRSTIRPLIVTKRPLLNRITKTPAPPTSGPVALQKPPIPVLPSLQATSVTSFLPVSPSVATNNGFDKILITKTSPSTTEPPATTTRATITTSSEETEKVNASEEQPSQTTSVMQTEEPITFIVPTQKVEVVKNDIKLPQIDLAKVEAVAAIAQQLVPSGVIASGSVSSEETIKPLETVTIKYEKITPTYLTETTPSYAPSYTQKISSIKFVPTTVVTSRPSAEEGLSDESSGSDIPPDSGFELLGIKNKVAVPQGNTKPTVSDKDTKGHEKLGGGGKDETSVESTTSPTYPSVNKGNFTVNEKKQTVKKPGKGEEKEEEDEEEEEEEEDLLEGVLSDEDDSDNEETEDAEDSSNAPSQTSNKNKVESSNAEDEEEDDDDDEEDDVLGETETTSQKVKPTKVSIKKPASDESNNEDDEEEEEEEDILDVLSDDDEEEESEDEDEDDEPENEKIKRKTTKAPPTTQATTIRIKKPTTQKVFQTKKPVTTTEKAVPTTPEEVTEKMPEKIFIYQEPVEKVTQKVVIYQEPQNNVPNKVFIYKEPEKTTEKVIFYEEPVQQTVTEKFVIYNEPEEEPTERPSVVLKDNNKSSEETKEEDSDEDEKAENDDEGSSEEELEDDSDSEKHTLMASIAKPGFSNKYAEEHDLTEADDLDIEDSEDDGNDFEEDRKMKQNQKKPVTKSPPPKKSPTIKSKILTLSSLIGQRKKYHDQPRDDRPISSSRTHRRMNLDRLLQV